MKKKLVFYIGGLNFGGMERVVFIAKKLLEEEYNVKIVTLYQNAADYEVKDEYYNLDVPPSNNKITTFIKRFVKTIKMKKQLKPDIVFSFGMYLNYLNILSNYIIKNKPTTIVGIRSYDWLTEPFLLKKTDKWVMKHANKINSVSRLIAKDAEDIWGISSKKNTVIYNPYDIEYINQKSLEPINDFEFKDNKYYVITMGRLSNQKGYNNLIRAFSEVVKKHEDIELLILGNGDKKEDLEKMITSYKMEKYIKMLGGKQNTYKYVKKANLYVLSSLTEGFPNALSEAMCLGIPVVSVNCKSGPAEILFDNNDFTYGNQNYYIGDYGILSREIQPDRLYIKKEISLCEKSLAEAICYAYENQEQMEELALKGKKHMEKFSYDVFHKKLIEILE